MSNVNRRPVISRPDRRVSIQLISASAILLACANADARLPERAAVSGSYAADSAAEAQFAKFLSISTATRTPVLGIYESVYCRDGEEYQLTKWLADFEILSVVVHDDSATAAARVTTVAEQDDHTGAMVATRKIRTEIAHWYMVRAPAGTGIWRVCGDAREGFGMIMTGPNMRWRPRSASRQKAFADVDSIRRARGKAVIR